MVEKKISDTDYLQHETHFVSTNAKHQLIKSLGRLRRLWKDFPSLSVWCQHLLIHPCHLCPDIQIPL